MKHITLAVLILLSWSTIASAEVKYDKAVQEATDDVRRIK